MVTGIILILLGVLLFKVAGCLATIFAIVLQIIGVLIIISAVMTMICAL